MIAQQLFSYRQLSRLRKSATAAGLSHRSCTISCVGWLWQLNRCSAECGATPHAGQMSDMPLVNAGLVTVQKLTVTRTQLGKSGTDWQVTRRTKSTKLMTNKSKKYGKRSGLNSSEIFISPLSSRKITYWMHRLQTCKAIIIYILRTVANS